MDDPVPTPDDLRAAWMDATRAAELAERLTETAREAADLADPDALAVAEIASLAESTAEAAGRAASTARAAATEAMDRGRVDPDDGVHAAAHGGSAPG